MPRFFFHLHNSIHAIDEEGVELPDLRTAREEAIRNARDIIAAEIRCSGRLTLSHWLEIEVRRAPRRQSASATVSMSARSLRLLRTIAP